MFSPARTVAYEGLIAHAAHQAMAGRPLLDGAVSMSLELDCQVPASWSAKKQRAALAGAVFPTTKPDADNVIKAICDGLNGVAWRDDVQVVDLRLRKRYAATPCVRVQIDTASA
jgi:Holliday junction resolvase RusA-like endonuclease